MGQDGERLAVVETQIRNLDQEMKSVKEDVKSINKQIWMASGMVIAVLTIVKVLLH